MFKFFFTAKPGNWKSKNKILLNAITPFATGPLQMGFFMLSKTS